MNANLSMLRYVAIILFVVSAILLLPKSASTWTWDCWRWGWRAGQRLDRVALLDGTKYRRRMRYGSPGLAATGGGAGEKVETVPVWRASRV